MLAVPVDLVVHAGGEQLPGAGERGEAGVAHGGAVPGVRELRDGEGLAAVQGVVPDNETLSPIYC